MACTVQRRRRPPGTDFQTSRQGFEHLAVEPESKEQRPGEKLRHELERGGVGLRGGIDRGCVGISSLQPQHLRRHLHAFQ